MRKGIALLLILLAALPLAGCRRRIDPNGEGRVFETVSQPEPAPIEGEGQKIQDPDLPPNPEQTRKERDAQGNVVDETIAAQGGETVPQGPEAPETGREITVTLDPVGGNCAKETVRVRAGGVYGILPVPTKAGMNFQGWFRQESGGEPINEVTAVLSETDHTLYAHWSEKAELLLTFDPNGGRISPYSAEKKIYPGNPYGELPEPLRSGYRFCGWFTEPEGGQQVLSTDLATVTDDQTLFAQWEYSPYDYWTFYLKNTREKLYTCQEISGYLEGAAQGNAMSDSDLLRDAGIGNILPEDGGVSDAWIQEKKPDVIVKLAENMGAAQAVKTAMELRFSGRRILVFPLEAVEGSPEEQLYYKLCLAEICYPPFFEDVDLNAVAQELGVTGSVLS